MYTGWISEIGEVVERADDRLAVRAPKSASRLAPGSSVSVAGVCVSVEWIEGDVFGARLSQETLRRSTLAELRAEARVNLELPLAAGSGLEGHLVQGHVDAIGKVVKVESEGAGRRVWIKPPERVIPDLVAKGSIAVDGASLTLAEVVRDRFSVALVPSTLADTTLGALAEGARVNLETDLIAKLVRHQSVQAAASLARAVRNSPWAGAVSGALGVEKVVQQVAAGGVVVVWDPERECEGDVICAGARLRPETLAFILTQACGYPCVPCDVARLARLEIPRLAGGGDAHGTAFHLPVDLASNPGTGVSAAERAATIRRLADADARPEDFRRPGHVNPLGAVPGGLRERAGHTEVTVALCAAAGLPTVGVCCEIMARDGRMASYDLLERLAVEWGVPLVAVSELIERL
jgi:3,4-dihydroxy 2-butanone 4-phosphate synthase/3,4-dihydroxy 2-butanone 4-phosphate synthase/GTP cyclohydrolase II